MSDGVFEDLDIAVVLPCYNEAETIGEVVAGFSRGAAKRQIYVYDNNSKDQTALRAALAGATVVREPRDRARAMWCAGCSPTSMPMSS
jgi:glycosyltransferase involved in cell wall biosynthesis